VSKLTINFTRESIEQPATFGAPIKTQVAGTEQDTVELEFFTDITATTIWNELYTAFKSTTGELYFEATYGTGSVSTDNPKWSGKCVVLGLDTYPEVGTLRQQSQTFPVTSAGVTRATA
jgi:hypothetical protein